MRLLPDSSPSSTAMSARDSKRANLYDATKSPSSSNRWIFVRNSTCRSAEGGIRSDSTIAENGSGVVFQIVGQQPWPLLIGITEYLTVELVIFFPVFELLSNSPAD